MLPPELPPMLELDAAPPVPALVVDWLLMPGLLVEPPPVAPIVVLDEELLSRGVLLVVPTEPVGLAPPEFTVLCAVVPVWACAGRQTRAVPAMRAIVVTRRVIIASPVCCRPPVGDNARGLVKWRAGTLECWPS